MLDFQCSILLILIKQKHLSSDSHLHLYKVIAAGPRQSCAFIRNSIYGNACHESFSCDFSSSEEKPERPMNKMGVQIPLHAGQSSSCQSTNYFWSQTKMAHPLDCCSPAFNWEQGLLRLGSCSKPFYIILSPSESNGRDGRMNSKEMVH